MTTAVAADASAGRAQLPTGTYRPSWVDSIVRLMDRAPGPTWLAYVVLALGAVAFFIIEAFAGGFALFDADVLVRLGYVLIFVFPLAAYHYLAHGATQAWDAFRPATNLDETAAARTRLELSTTPFRPVAVIWLVAATANLVSSLAYPDATDLVGRPLLYVALRVASESFWVAPMAIVLVYLIVRQLRLIARLHRAVEQVDLLRPGPLHAMSRLTGRSATVLVVLAVVIGLPLPGNSEAAWLATVFLFSLPFIVLAVVVFFVPLRGMHGRLVAEKSRRLDEVSIRLDAATGALHDIVDAEAVNGTNAEQSRHAQTRIDALNKALASLLQERDFVRRLSPWPWDASTLRAVVSAVLLPIGLFLLTRVLDRFV